MSSRVVSGTGIGRLVQAGLVGVLLATTVAAADWPQWRGPDGQGHAAAEPVPVRWSETEHVAWKTPLAGRGWSSPVIAGEQIWVTTAIESQPSEEERQRRLANRAAGEPVNVAGTLRLHAVCVDRGSGRILHDVELFVVEEPQPIHALNSYASPSPVLAAGRLYCHFGDFGTACVDTATAQVVWATREVRLNHENGPGSTPVVWRNRLIVHCDGTDRQEVVALDTATGAVAWRTPRSGGLRDDPQLKKAYGTPLLVSVDGRDVVVSPGADWLYGYDPETGRELWRLSYGVLGFSTVPRPVAAHGLVYMSTGFMQPEMLAVRIGDAAAEIVWREKKGVPAMPSPLVVGDELYMVSDKGIATCLDAHTGAAVWSERLGGNFCSSPLVAGGRIYVSNREGQTFVIAPGRTFALEATNTLDGQIFATPAVVDGAVYIRTDAALYRIDDGPAVAAVETAAATDTAAAEPAAAPTGDVIERTFASSRIFPGTTRPYWVYVPRQYDGTTPACVHVNQDGIQFDAPKVFDRLIHEKKMPVTIGVFVMHGRVPAGREGALDRYNRSYEYDGLGDAYARFILEELLPEVETLATADGRKIRLSADGNDRSIGGTSSGAICAFTAAWERPDAFRRVFSGIGTYVGLRGGHGYATLVRKVEPKPLRVFLQAGSNDLDIYGGDWWIANQALERSLRFAGYEVRHAWGDGGHDNKQATAEFPAAMEWLWSGWPGEIAAGSGSPQLQEILLPDEPWRLVGSGYGFTEGPAVNAAGELFFNDVAAGTTYRVTADWKAERWLDDSHRADGQAFAADGRLVAASAADEALLAWSPDKRPTVLAKGWRGNDLVVAASGAIYATEPDWNGRGPSKVHHVSPDGRDTVVDTGLGFANGICLSTDQSLLYVADSRSHWVWSFVIQPDGGLAQKQRYYHLHVPDTADDAGADGMRVDRDGRLWVATRMGLQVCDQAGRVNCIIPTPNGRVSNLCFGGPAFDVVLATCGDTVYARRVKVTGAPAFLPPTTPPKPRL